MRTNRAYNERAVLLSCTGAVGSGTDTVMLPPNGSVYTVEFEKSDCCTTKFPLGENSASFALLAAS